MVVLSGAGPEARALVDAGYLRGLLQDAIARKSKVSFRYCKYDASKERIARRGGAAHVVTPVNLTYSDGNYYLAAYSAPDGEIRNYRVDRMGRIVVAGEHVERNEVIASYDSDEAARTAFDMYDGERVVMTLKVDADLMNVVVDRFGRDVDAAPSDDGKAATVSVPVRESLVLYGWIAILGDGAEILRSGALRDSYTGWLKGILGKYSKQQ